MLREATDGAVFLLNSPFGPEHVWDELPRAMQETIIRKRIRFYVIDADRVATEAGMAGRINTIMQTCFFAISGVLPRDEAIRKIKDAIEATYARKGRELVEKNFAAVDCDARASARGHGAARGDDARARRSPLVPAQAPPFVRQVTAMMMAGRGDELPVSAMPADGTYPSGDDAMGEAEHLGRRARVEAGDLHPVRQLRDGVPARRDPRPVLRRSRWLQARPRGSPLRRSPGAVSRTCGSRSRWRSKTAPGASSASRPAPPGASEAAGVRAINMEPKAPVARARAPEPRVLRRRCPTTRRSGSDAALVRGVQYLTPLFEYSGACAGCGETPYLRLLTQLFGDRLLVANATGCSSIYGGNLPTTPWTINKEGRGPAWANSLFEDNAEFGLGFRLSLDKHREQAAELLKALEPQLGTARVREILEAPQSTQDEMEAQRRRIAALDAARWRRWTIRRAPPLQTLAGHLVRKSVWIVGGDGWAYDIGYGGLDHVLASGRNVNILVLDTEVYSNTGGQASKSTPRAAVAKFAAGGKRGRKKDLGLMAMAYGNVYVAQIAMGASPQQTVDAFLEAEAHDGPVAHHRLQPLHRARHQHALRHAAAEAGGRLRSLAALPLPAGRRRPRRQEFVLDSQAAVDPAEDLRVQRDPLQDALVHQTGGGQAAPRAGAGRRRSALAGLLEPGRAVAGAARRGQGEPGSHVPRDATHRQ